MDLRLGSRGNIYLDHNFYDNATIFFNPILGQVAIEGEPRDIYFYYHNNADTNGTEGLTLLLNKESMNTVNYSIGGKEFTQGSEGNLHIPLTFTSESFTDSESGISYDNYWTCKIPNGLELPAGQLFTISVENANGVASTYWATIQGKNVKILDSVKVFVEIPSNNKSDIKSISYRVYGYAKDGASVKVLDGDKETAATAQDETGWITLEKVPMNLLLHSAHSTTHGFPIPQKSPMLPARLLHSPTARLWLMHIRRRRFIAPTHSSSFSSRLNTTTM